MAEIKLFLQRKELILSAIFLVNIFLNFSCKKPEEEIGSEVQPEDGKLGYSKMDTLSLFAYSVYDDSVVTGRILGSERGLELGSAILGAYWDPVFGVHASDIYTQLHLEKIAPTFGEDPTKLVVDSVIFSLLYLKDYYGNINSKQILRVNELSEDFKDSINYYYDMDSVPAFAENLVEPGNEWVDFNPNTESKYDTTLSPHLRVFLKKSFGEKVLKASADNLIDQDAFKKFVKGLKISTANPNLTLGGGGLFMFNIVDDTSKVTIYYRDLAVSDTVTKSFTLKIGNTSPTGSVKKFERFRHNYANSEVGNDILGGTSFNRTKIYVQSMGGVKGILKIPYLERLKDLNIGINKAELIFSVMDAGDDKFDPSTSLGIFAFKNETMNTSRLIEDCYASEILVYAEDNGEYNKENRQYKINITYHFQQLLNGKADNFGFSIETRNRRSEPNRSIIYGPADPDPTRRMRLEITYTNFNL